MTPIMILQDEMHPSQYFMRGWGWSVLLHLGVFMAVVVVGQKVTLVAEPEPFQWEVALVQPAADQPRTESASTPAVQPSKPAPVRTVQTPQPVQPVEPVSDMVMTRVATQYSPEIVHQTIAQPKPEPVQEIVQAKVQPVVQQEMKKEEVKPEPVLHEQRPAPVAKEFVQPVETVATAQTYEPPAPAHVHRAEAAPVIHHESPSPEEMAPEWRPLVAVREGAAIAVTEPPAASSAPAESTAVAAAPVSPQPSPAPLVAKAAPVPSATKGDNAWLAESLGRRIKELTRYPSSARLNGTEGKVVLRVILRADGHLSDVTVHRSSGHEVLDRAAMETVRLACPIHMKQALSAAEVAVYVPIVYSLAG